MDDKRFYNLYCDESCHLQNDCSDVMCVGGIIVPCERIEEYKSLIKAIKRKYGILQEIKWNTISATHIRMYEEIISFFFDSEMSFHCVLIKNKSNISVPTLGREEYNAFYFSIIERLIRYSIQHKQGSNNVFKVFLDLKDSHGSKKLESVENALLQELDRSNKVSHLQNIRSHESVFIQLADIFIGAITYRTRGLNGSLAKVTVVEQIERMAGYILNEGTEPGDDKFSIYDFQPKKRNG